MRLLASCNFVVVQIKDVREALLPSPGQEGPEVIVGGTTLLTPEKLYQELFDKLR